ncbi:MAG: AI-2E family transporter [Planctomycetota bacterium]
MILSALILGIILAVLRYLSDVLIPFVIAVVLAYLLNPLVTIFEHRTKSRGAAVGITIGGLGVLGAALLVLVVPLVYGQVVRFGYDLSKLRSDLAASFQAVPAPKPTAPLEFVGPLPGEPKTALGYRELQRGWREFQAQSRLPRAERIAQLAEEVHGTYVGDLLDAILKYVNSEDFGNLVVNATASLAKGGLGVINFAINLILGLTGMILVLLYLVFLLLDFPDYVRNWKGFLPPQYRTPLVEFLEEFDLALRRYLRGQSVASLLYGSLLSLGFWMIGLPMAVPIGLIIGMLSLVPYLQTVGIIPVAFLAVMRSIEGESTLASSLLLSFAVFGAVQTTQDWLITPRIMGKATGLRPVAVLLGVFVWGKLLGTLGLLLAIPLTCLGIAYYRRYILQTVDATALPTPDVAPSSEN